MANHQAIPAVCQAVIEMLRSRFKPEVAGGQKVEFKVALAQDLNSLAQNTSAQITLYLYRVDQNSLQRNTPIRFGPEQGGRLAKMSVDLAFLLTAWAGDAALQHSLTGWMLQVMASHPLLTSTLLNQAHEGTFQPEETVEVIPVILSNAEIHQIWEGVGPVPYFLSIPFQARNISIDLAD
jgi:hypothetical protein